MSTTLEYYWDLASIDPAKRQQAAHSLLTTLANFQKSHQEAIPKSQWTSSLQIANQEKALDSLCPQDVSYALKRLIRGLPSSRDGARQGFALALTGLLSQMSFFSFKLVWDLLLKNTEVTGGMKGQEERDMVFGRVFGALAFVRAGMLERDTTSFDEFKAFVDGILEWSLAKSYLKEACFEVLIDALTHIKSSSYKKEAIPYIITTVLKDSVQTPEELWFALAAQQEFPTEVDWKVIFKSWKNNRIFDAANTSKLVDIIKETTSTVPRLHSSLSAVFETLTSESSASTMGLKDIWPTLSTTLFNGTHFHKYLGFLIFQQVLSTPQLPQSALPFLFTTPLIRTLINHLSEKDNYLHKIATKTIHHINTVANTRQDIGFALVMQLTGPSGNKSFDAMTKTKTVQTLLTTMNEQGVTDYVNHLISLFESDESQRNFVMEQIGMVMKNKRAPKSEQVLMRVVEFLVMKGLLDTEVSEPLRANIRARFFNILPTTHISKTNHLITKLLAKSDEEIMDPETRKMRTAALKLGDKLCSTTDNEKATQFGLLIHTIVLHMLVEDDMMEDLGEVTKCWEEMNATVTKKKRKATQEDADQPPAIDIFVDILISFLSKSHSLLRVVSEGVFKAFVNDLTSTGLENMVTVLEERLGGKESGVLEIEDEDEDGMEVDDAEENDDEEEEEEEEEEDEDEDDEIRGDVDEELRNKIAQALQQSNPTGDSDNESSSDDEGLGDEEMEAFDAKLAEIFRHRKMEKTQVKELKQQLLNFKLRILSFLEIFFRRNTASELIAPLLPRLLTLLRTTPYEKDTEPFHNKLGGILKKLAVVKNPKELPSMDVSEIAKQVFELSSKGASSNSKAFSEAVAGVCGYLVKIAIQFGNLNGTDSQQQQPKKKKKTTKSSESTSNSIAQLYSTALTTFLTQKHCQHTLLLFSDLVNRHHAASVQILLPTLINHLTPTSVGKPYQLLQSWNLLARIVNGMNTKTALKIEQKPHMISVMKNIMTGMKLIIEKDIKTKEILKGYLNVLRRVKKLTFEGDEESFSVKSEVVHRELVEVLKGKMGPQSPVAQMARQTVELMESM